MKISSSLKIVVAVLLTFSLISALSVFIQLNKMSEDGRVVNYSGIVRGATQRLVKLEMGGQIQEKLIAKLDGIINGLINGSTELQLPKATDKEFISKMKDVEKAWGSLKETIVKARQDKNYNGLLKESEDYFELTNKAVAAAESFSKRKVAVLKTIQVILFVLNLIILAFIWIISGKNI